MRWVALAAHSGPSSIGLWILAAVAFFIPQGLAVTALSSSIPEEGGLYVWTTRAFGPRQGFLCGWLYSGFEHHLHSHPRPDDGRLRRLLHVQSEIRLSREERDLRRNGGDCFARDCARFEHRRAEDRQVGSEHRRSRPVAPLRGPSPRRNRGARPRRVGDRGFHARLSAFAFEFRHDFVLRVDLLRVRGPRARADARGRGRGPETHVPARDRDLGNHDRRLLHRGNDFADVGDAPGGRSRSFPASTRRSRLRARSTGWPGSALRSRS